MYILSIVTVCLAAVLFPCSDVLACHCGCMERLCDQTLVIKACAIYCTLAVISLGLNWDSIKGHQNLTSYVIYPFVKHFCPS